MQKVVKYSIFLFILYVLYATFNNYQELQEQKIQNTKSLKDTKLILDKKLMLLEKIKSDYSTRLEFINSNKLLLDKYNSKINVVIDDINNIDGFSVVLLESKLSKIFINVGLIKLKISSDLSMFNISEFESIFTRRLSQIGYVLPFVYTSEAKNEANINILVLKKTKNEEVKK